MVDERKPIELEGRYKVRWSNLTRETNGQRGWQEDVAKRAKTQAGVVSGHLSRTRRIGDKMAEAYEKAFKRPKGSMDQPNWGRSNESGSDVRIAEQMVAGRLIKVIGEYDGTTLNPSSHGSERLFYCTTDPGAYAIRVLLDWALPRLRHDEMLVLEPNTKANAGDTVSVKLKTGELRFGSLSEVKEKHISLTGFASAPAETILASRIEHIHLISAVLLHVV